MFCSSDSVQIPPSGGTFSSQLFATVLLREGIPDKISVTPGESSSFVIKDIVLTSMVRNWSLPWS